MDKIQPHEVEIIEDERLTCWCGNKIRVSLENPYCRFCGYHHHLLKAEWREK